MGSSKVMTMRLMHFGDDLVKLYSDSAKTTLVLFGRIQALIAEPPALGERPYYGVPGASRSKDLTISFSFPELILEELKCD
jgi:hypothetical protein